MAISVRRIAKIMTHLTHLPQHQFSLFETSSLTPDKKINLFNMYLSTYKCVGQEVWFKDENKMFSCYTNGITSQINNNICFILYRKFGMNNKLSVLIHDSTREGKDLLMNTLAYLVTKPGWIFECTGAPYHILKTKYNIDPIVDEDKIKSLLNCSEIKYEIIMNKSEDKTYTYTRGFKEDDTVYENRENLFGTIILE